MPKAFILWCAGGFTAGCILGAVGVRAFLLPTCNVASNALDEIKFLLSQSKFERGTENVLSNMTLLLGSPTASDVLETIEYPMYGAVENYPNLNNNRSLMARYLTMQLYNELHTVQTTSGFTIDQCIQTGVDNPDRITCGIVAGDEECYDVFAQIFDPVISDRHRGFKRGEKPHDHDLTTLSLIKTTPFDPNYVKSTHFLVGRCIRGFRFPPSCSRAERKQTENLLKLTLQSLKGDFEGTYLHLTDLSREDKLRLPDILQSIAEKPSSRTLECSGSTRDWPNGRGVFYNKKASLFAWTNREDHLRVMHRERIMDFAASFRRFCRAMNELEKCMKENGIEFVFHQDYGYLLTCPSGIGTGLRAGVHMRLPNLLQDPRFRTILKNLRLHMGADDPDMLNKGYVDVYNMDRLGYSETYLVQHVANGVHKLCEMENRLEAGETISDLLINITTLKE